MEGAGQETFRSSAPPIVDVSRVIDEQRLGLFAARLAILSFIVMMTDGYDLLAASYAAPKLVAAWHLDRASLGPVFAASPLGMMVGAPLLGWIGDRVGRRKTILIGVLSYGLCSLACAFTQSLEALVALRFLTGVGLGGTLPNVTALNAEYAPARIRARLIIFMFMGVTVGGAVPGAIIALVPAIRWETLYLAGGAAPLLLLPALALWMPESVKFLLLSRRADAQSRILDLMRKVSPKLAIDDGTQVVRSVVSGTLKGAAVADLFRSGLRYVTPLLWCVFIIDLGASYFLYSWLPILLHAEGFSASATALVTMGYYVGGVVGAIVISPMIDKRGFSAITVYFFLAAIAVITVGVSGVPVLLKALAVAMSGFFILGTQLGLNAASGMIYDTAIRATGAGWAFGLGRLGGFAGPMIGASLMAAHVSSPSFFAVPFAALLVGAAASSVIGRLIRARAAIRSMSGAARIASSP